MTTPIRRITHSGIETTDDVVHDADLIVAATGYEMWTDPETYLPATILGRSGFDLAQVYRTSGLRSYAGTCRPELPNRWEIVGPLGFVGCAWFDYVETMAGRAVRLIDEARRRGADAVSVSTALYAVVFAFRVREETSTGVTYIRRPSAKIRTGPPAGPTSPAPVTPGEPTTSPIAVSSMARFCLPRSWRSHRFGPDDVSFEAKRFRHRAIATHQVAVGIVVAAGPG